MPLARRCTFQLRTLSLFWEVRGGAGGTTTARSGYPSSPRPGPLRSTSRRDRRRSDIVRPPGSSGRPSVARAACHVPTSMPAPRRRAAFRPRRAQAPVWRSEVPERARARPLPRAAPLVASGCLALRCVHSPAPAPQRCAAFRPRRVQAPVWRSEAPARARARSAPSAAPLVALSRPALCCLAVKYQRSLAAISSCGAGRQRRPGRGGLTYPMCVRVDDSASRPAQLAPSASGVT